MSVEDFQSVMASRSDEQLIAIVGHEREDYQQAAIQAAEEELKTRNLDPEIFRELNTRIDEQNEERAAKAEKQLATPFKILFGFFSFTLIPYLIAMVMKADGKEGRYRDAIRSLKRGLLAWFIAVIVLAILNEILS